MQKEMKTIREAATALCDRWDTPLWKDVEHTAVLVHSLRTALAQPQEANNFCPRCGKRTPDPAAIHTCAPPRGLEMT